MINAEIARDIVSANDDLLSDFPSMRHDLITAIQAALDAKDAETARWRLVADTKGSMHDASTCTHAIEADRLRQQLADAKRATWEQAIELAARVGKEWHQDHRSAWSVEKELRRAMAEDMR